jgi:tetratricopeptide (TPR) repeat protein
MVELVLVLALSAQIPSQGTSLLGKPLIPAPPAEAARERLEANLATAREQYNNNPNEADAIIWLGRRLAYLGRYRDAIAMFTEGIEKHPRDARMYRHRGHRYITVRELDKAVADFRKAAELIAGRPDEVEPDGQPNAKNIPTSTLNTNVFYHLGLAHYLRGEFVPALAAYRECIRFSKNPDMLVATTHWLYMTLRRLDRPGEARQALEPITGDMAIIENASYHRLLMLYKGAEKADALASSLAAGSLDFVTVGYGLGNWHLYNGRPDQARMMFRQIVEQNEPQWPAFGYLAAEAELARKSSAAEPAGVHLDQPAHLFQRFRAVVHLQPEDDVVVQPHAAVLLDDQHGRRLHAARIAARRLTGIERRHQAQREMSRGLLERVDHAGDDGFAREDVALRGAERSALVPCPGLSLRSRVRSVIALRIHDRELPALFRPRPAVQAGIRIAVENRLDDRRRREPSAQQLQRLRPVAHVDNRLCRGDADVGFGPEHAVPDREHARLHRPADLAGFRVVAEDREGGNRIGKRGLRRDSGFDDRRRADRQHERQDEARPAERGWGWTEVHYRHGIRRSIHCTRVRSL